MATLGTDWRRTPPGLHAYHNKLSLLESWRGRTRDQLVASAEELEEGAKGEREVVLELAEQHAPGAPALAFLLRCASFASCASVFLATASWRRFAGGASEISPSLQGAERRATGRICTSTPDVIAHAVEFARFWRCCSQFSRLMSRIGACGYGRRRILSSSSGRRRRPRRCSSRRFSRERGGVDRDEYLRSGFQLFQRVGNQSLLGCFFLVGIPSR